MAKLSISYFLKLDLTAPYAARGGLSIALLLAGLLGAASQAAAAELPAVEAVTYDGPKVTPHEFSDDLRHLPLALPAQAPAGRPYRPLLRPPVSPKIPSTAAPTEKAAAVSGPLVPMPSPAQNFAGMSFTDACAGGTCGAGWPPDPNGDVGPNHYIQAVNSAYAIYNKTGTLLASFTENQLWAGNGTICNGSSSGDPVVLYDWLADRWILTHFAFASNSGPFYQCIAASKTSDPVAGGWWMYAVRMDPGGTGQPPVGKLNDYSKFGLWHDCLYMGANEFDITTNPETYLGVAFASFSRSDLYSGAALTYSLGFLGTAPGFVPFTLIPSNNQGKGANAAQPGTPNYFVSESGTAFEFEVRKFTAGANCGGGGTLSTVTSVSQASYPFSTFGNVVPQPNTTNMLDNIDDRIMQKVQYRKIGGVESLWVTHNVDTASGPTAMQWAQIDITGGTIATTPVQQQIYAPDTTLWRWMGSLAVDNQGNMALGYSTSNGSSPNFPSIAYSGRLATDPLNTLPQTEVQLIAGAGSQTNNCGGAPCNRWGDYTAMSVDPTDDCTFWYTNQYYSSQANGASGNWQTRVGSFKFPSCVNTYTLTVTSSGGTVSGTAGSTSINCTSGAGVCSAIGLASGAAVSLTAIPASGNVFNGWSGSCSGKGGCSFNIGSSNASVTATFAATPSFTVTGVASPSAGGTVSCTSPVNSGNTTACTITTNSGYTLTGASSNTCGGSLSGNTYTTGAVTSNCTVTANFTQFFAVTGVVNPAAGGSVSCTSPVASGNTTTCVITAASGYTLTGASSSTCGGSLSGATYTTGAVTSACTVTASFTAATTPGAPTAVSATAGIASINVNFGAPASNGGPAITGYSATCTSSNGGVSGSNTGGASATSIRVGGLINGKSYTCTVTASNSAGAGPASAASNAVTPFDITFDITPILFLLLD